MKQLISMFLASLCVLTVLSGCSSGTGDSEKERMQDMYGENKVITDGYDETLAAVCHNGTYVGLEDNGVISYKGIPYAKPPIGNLRWKAPVLVEDDNGVYEAYYYGHSPLQSEWPSEVGSYYPQSEDCLTLNVWTNLSRPQNEKNVMVFFHGGSYGWGAISDPMYDGHNLVKKYPDLVLVTVEYRVGMMGFVDFSSVPGGENFTESGNLGLLDQICALKWIQKNIAAFGGDPENVTIFGESAGAGSVSLLPLIREADGLYHRVIAESGSVALTYSKEECQKLTSLLLEESGCQTMDELMGLSEAELVVLNEELSDYNNFPERDGAVLPEDLYAAYEQGDAASVDMMIGTNADEVRYWIREMGYYQEGVSGMTIYKHGFPIMYENNLQDMTESEKANVNAFMELQSGKKIWKITELYNELLFRVPAMKQAELHAENGNTVYTYYWTMPGSDKTVGACHAIELAYVFGNPQETIYNGSLYDESLADKVQDMWVNFARTGNPSTETIAWEPYAKDARYTIILGEDTHMETDLKNEQRQLIEPLLEHYFNGCYSQLRLMVPQTWRIGGQLIATLLLTAAAIAMIVITIKKRKKKG